MMEVIYGLGEASATDVQTRLEDPPSYSAVRATLAILEQKGHLRHESRGNRYVYLPTVSPDKARRSALRGMLDTFFGGSPKEAVVALIDEVGDELSEPDLREITRLLAEARQKGR